MAESRNESKENSFIEDVHNIQSIQKPEAKVSWIYEQYHDGKTLTIDDFKYLCRKDPEGCKRMIHSIIENKRHHMKNDRRIQTEQVAMEYISKLQKEVSLAQARLKQSGNEVKPEGKQTLESVKESLANVKQMILVMDQQDLADMMNHLYEVSELRWQYEDELLGWEMLLEETDRYYMPYQESRAEYRV